MAQPKSSHPVLGMRQWKVEGGRERQQSPEVVVGGCDGTRGGTSEGRGGSSRIRGGAWRFTGLHRQWARLVMPRIGLGSVGGASSSRAGFCGAVWPIRKHWEGRRA